MGKQRRSERKTADTLNYLWAAALAITLAIAIGIYTVNKYGELANPRLLAGTAVLAGATILLFVRYLTACHHELRLLEEYFSPSIAPRLGPTVYYNAFLLAVVFGILIAISHLILIYAALIILLNVADLWGGWQGKGKITTVFDKQLAMRLNPKRQAVVETMRDYYLGNPTLERVATVMFFNWVAFSFALVGYCTRRQWCRDIAYLIVILNIVIAEVVIHRWRVRRDRKIERIDPAGV